MPALPSPTSLNPPSPLWRLRRRLYGTGQCLIRPEYWPAWVLYTPVVLMLLSRAFRKGKQPLDFTACNPCMPNSGLVGESKLAILDHIGARDAIAAYRRIPGPEPLDAKCRIVTDFMREQELTFPVVIKPDVGERGSGVVIAKSGADVRSALTDTEREFMVQAFIPGTEYGVFYIRPPEEQNGRIFAITRKSFQYVTGDGQHTLADLILLDSRAVCQAAVHFRQLRHRLQEIPPAGKHIQLTDIGNHCRGTLFEDGADLITPALEQRIDAISKSLPGFHFGRYDLIAPGEAEFMRGENLKIIELNGVSSEATGMYDPRNGYRTMVKTLLTQWRIASEIGNALRSSAFTRFQRQAFRPEPSSTPKTGRR